MKLTAAIATIVCASRLVAAEPVKLIDLDFSRAQTGCLSNHMDSARLPATIDTFSAYGRLRGKSAIPEEGRRYATAALGRTGQLNALQLGNAGQALANIRPLFQTGKPFTLETWVYVYDVDTYFGGLVLNILRGYKTGLRLGFGKAKWAPKGLLYLTWGTKTGSDKIHVQNFFPDKWHQIVMSYDGKQLALYVDGALTERKDAALDFTTKGAELFVGKKFSAKDKALDFKLDLLTIYADSLSEETIKAHYTSGAPTQLISAEREAKLQALKLAIPRDTYGYFQTGQTIPVLFDETSEADELVVNGAKHALPLRKPVELSFATPGLRNIELALTTQGNVLKQATYPVAIVPYEINSSKLGAVSLASRQPEVCALGMKLSRVVVSWAELEPQKQEYNWRRLNAVVKRNQELGAETILCLTGMPRWVKRANGSANLPADMTLYTKIWRLLASRYDGVTYFEVWNATTPGNSLKGPQAQKLQDYCVLLQAAAEAVRHEIPDAKILAGRIDTSDGLKTAASLQKNAAKWYDIFSAKNYAIAPAKNYRKKPWSAKLVKQTAKPVWNTAGGVQQFARVSLVPSEQAGKVQSMQKTYPIPTVGEWTGAAWQIQALALQLADGVQRVILASGPSEYASNSSATTGLPGLKGLALAVFNGLIGKKATVSWLPQAPAGVFAVRFENPDGRKGLILFTSGEKAVVKVNAQAPGSELMDLFGNSLSLESGNLALSEQPVYLLNTDSISQ
jgi:hypothetical protein